MGTTTWQVTWGGATSTLCNTSSAATNALCCP
jgi:hypothetical protein